MTLQEELAHLSSIFLDTAPIIYYIEAHPVFGPVVKEVVTTFQSGSITAFASVISLTEVLSKPIERGDLRLSRKFADFLKHGKNLILIEISQEIAETAGKLRGRYPSLKTADALQIAAAQSIGSETFLTNDRKLSQIKELKVIVLNDYL